MEMLSGSRRLIWPAISLALELALGLSGYHSPVLADALLVLTLVLLIVAVWPWLSRVRIRLAVLPNPHNPLSQRHPEELSSIPQLNRENTELREANQDLQRALNEAKAGFENREDEARELRQKLEYGEKLPSFPRLADDPTFSRVLDHVHELRPSIRDTLAGADQVWAHLSAMIVERAEAPPWKSLSWRLDRLNATERLHLGRVISALEAVLQYRHDPRPYLAGAYICYRKWRDQMADVADTFGHPLGLTPGAIPWFAAERRFLEDLRRKLEVPGLAAVREVIAEYDKKHGPLKDLSQVR
jgi:hypothetical protein